MIARRAASLASLASLALILLAPRAAWAAGPAASEDVETPQAPRKAEPGDGLPTYRPTEEETARLAPSPPPPPPEPPSPWIAAAHLELQSFQLGTARGSSSELMLYFGSAQNGVTLGEFNGGQAFSLGYSAFSYMGAEIGPKSGPVHFYFLTPDMHIRLYAGSGIFAMQAGASLLGFRAATCRWEASVRLATTDFWFVPAKQIGFAISTGATLSGGLLF